MPLLTRYNSTPTEVVWAFDAALCMWAFMRLSELSLISDDGSSFRHQEYVLSWKAASSLDDWIQSGEGNVSVQGIGTGKITTVQAILESAANRLDIMSWGFAARYRDVLRDLLAQAPE